MKLKKYAEFGVLLILISLLFFGGSQSFNTRSSIELWNLGHIILFALLFVVALREIKWLNRKKLPVQFMIILVVTIVLGLLIEWIQLFIGRTSEYIDVWRNVVGALLAFVYSKNFNSLKSNVIKISRIVVFILILFTIYPLIKTLTDEIQAQRDFPVIANFENPFEIEKWYGNSDISLNNEIVKNGKYSLKAQLQVRKYSGISLSYFPRNWEKYTTLKFSVYSESQIAMNLVCRVHDINHNNQFNDRFNKRISVKHGWNDVTIRMQEIINAPQGRTMDITNIKNFALFASDVKERKIIYFDYLRLE